MGKQLYCDIAECVNQSTHTRWYHKCVKCKSRGHGVKRCGKVLFYLGTYHIENFDTFMCEIKNCPSPHSHITAYHY